MKTGIGKRKKSIISIMLAFVLFSGTLFTVNVGINVNAFAAASENETDYSVWSGSAAEKFEGGTGVSDDPYIIKTADQLYKMVSGDGLLSDGAMAYYKVADGITTFYLNDILNNDSLDGIKELVGAKNHKNWTTSNYFKGNFDGNGVTIRGMVSYNANSFVYGLVGGAAVKNINFDSCYVYSSGSAAVLTTRIGSYQNETDTSTVANISVRNVYVQTTRKVTVNDSGAHSSSAGGIISTTDTSKMIELSNCFFDGYSSELIQGSGSAVDATAGIFACATYSNNITIKSCVSLGAQVLPQATGAVYTRYDENNNSGFQVKVYNSYCDLDESVKETPVIKIDVKAEYQLKDIPSLDWIGNWHLITVTDGLDDFDGATQRIIPYTKANSVASTYSTYAEQISAQTNGWGAHGYLSGGNLRGTYGMYHKLMGSGTENDPYLIYTAFDLARAISSGGKNVYQRVYYKLACDIDATGMLWITQDSITKSNQYTYQYVAFAGQLDGDGHTVTGISAGDDQSAGLIPVLAAEGVVKNIHLRNCTVVSGSGYAGAIAGEVEIGAQVIGCSVEDCTVSSAKSDSHIIGRIKGLPLKNSYYIADENSTVENKTRYYNAVGAIDNIDVEDNSEIWYIGGKEGSTPKLKSFALSQSLVDVDGDGAASEYTSRDLVALRRMLLMDDDYKNIYGDVDRNGETNIVDLIVLCNEMIGDYSNATNDFWRNVRLAKVNIYYGENDNYDAARRLELYLEEAVPTTDVKKIVSADKTVTGTDSDSSAVYVHKNDETGSPDGTLEIIVGNIENYSDYATNSLDINDYAITYNSETGVLWFKGGSFTGVEQAVLDFISGSDAKTGKIYTVENATLAAEKQAKTVMIDTNYDGVADTQTTMYYAWGDEFNGNKTVAEGENAEISLDVWATERMNGETLKGEGSRYRNMETANSDEISKLYYVKDGRLSITRGVVASAATDVTDQLGYVRLYNQTGTTVFNDSVEEDDIYASAGLIKTNVSMLYKQGYAEMYGSIPSDGHVFASWWLLSHGALNNTAYSESLFSKVYKLNNSGEFAYDGTSETVISTDLSTFKYQIPSTCFEIDIWELMQNDGMINTASLISGLAPSKSRTTGVYDYGLYLNVHKFYSIGANKADTVNIINWNDPANPIGTISKSVLGSSADDYYFSTSAQIYGFTDGTSTRYTTKTDSIFGYSRTYPTAYYVEELQRQLTANRRYGFYWSTNGVDKFNFTLYIYDVNGDGIEGDDAILGTCDLTYNNENGYTTSDYDIVNDAVTANQYMYMLFDNIFYAANSNHSDSTTDTAVQNTDLLTDEGTAENPDKINLEIDYVRVYQLDGRRDIVTPETEDFNNGNHFGY